MMGRRMKQLTLFGFDIISECNSDCLKYVLKLDSPEQSFLSLCSKCDQLMLIIFEKCVIGCNYIRGITERMLNVTMKLEKKQKLLASRGFKPVTFVGDNPDTASCLLGC